MLTDDDYDVAKAVLSAHELPIVGASGHNGPFGSWHITVRTAKDRGLRLAYDGRDRFLYVDFVEIGQPEAWSHRLIHTLLVDRQPGEGAVREALGVMLRAAGRKDEAVPS